MIRVYIVDDHPFVREGLKTCLGTDQSIEIVGEADNARKASSEIVMLKPDIAIVDLRLPDISGIELAEIIKKQCPFVKILILSSFSEAEDVMAAVDMGVSGYMTKDASSKTVLDTIHQLYKGESVLHPRAAKIMLQQKKEENIHLMAFTPKEREVLKCLVKGMSNAQIGKTLLISNTTVKSHITNIFRKLNVTDRTNAVLKAIEMNITVKDSGL